MSIQRLSNSGQSGYRYKSLIAGITPVASVPTIGAATALTFSTASVAFTAPGAYAATTFTATSSPGGLTATSASSPITVSGLSENTAYTFTVSATNATGTSSPSAASSSITTPSAFSPESGYDALATVTLSSATASVTFAGIPQTYTHLEIRSFAANSSATGQYVKLIFNSDSASGNYSEHHLAGNGTAASAGGNASFNNGGFFWAMGIPGTNTANVFGAGVTSILDYANTNKYKTVRSLDGFDANGSGGINLVSNNWRSNSAITSIILTPNESNNFRQYSSFALYGVK